MIGRTREIKHYYRQINHFMKAKYKKEIEDCYIRINMYNDKEAILKLAKIFYAINDWEVAKFYEDLYYKKGGKRRIDEIALKTTTTSTSARNDLNIDFEELKALFK